MILIPSADWMDFAMSCLKFEHPYKQMHTAYQEDWKAYVEGSRADAPEAREVDERYQAWLVTRRLKA